VLKSTTHNNALARQLFNRQSKWLWAATEHRSIRTLTGFFDYRRRVRGLWREPSVVCTAVSSLLCCVLLKCYELVSTAVVTLSRDFTVVCCRRRRLRTLAAT